MSEPETKSGLTFPQIAASALAAATAAILGSFMGVLGTIGGAAAASIISTVGSSLYQRSLERTRDRVKQRLVVGAGNTRVGSAVARATGLNTAAQPAPDPRAAPNAQSAPSRPAGAGSRPGAGAPVGPPGGPGRGGPPNMPRSAGFPVPGRPGDRTTQQAGAPQAPAPRGAPQGDRTLRTGGRLVTGLDPVGPTRQQAMPTTRIPDARFGGGPVVGPHGPTAGPNGPGGPGGPPPPTAYLGAGGPDDDATRLTGLDTGVGEAATPKRKRGWKTYTALAGLAASIFAIGLLASFGVESAAGHPLSGGTSGTSVGSLFGQTTGAAASTTSSDDPASDDDATATTTANSDRGADESSAKATAQSSAGATSKAPASTSAGATRSQAPGFRSDNGGG